MATRPCLRCSKLVPETAAFCRRCGYSVLERPAPARVAAPAGPEAPPEAAPARGRWPGVIVTTALTALTAVLGLFTASLPPAARVPSDPGPPREAEFDTDAGAERLARMTEHLAEARQRIHAAGERLASARQRFDWRLTGEAPRLLPTTPLVRPAPTPRRQGEPPAARIEALASAALKPIPGRPGGPQTVQDVARANVPGADAPRITGFSQGWGPAGKRVAIDGRGFVGTSRVVFAAPGGAG